MDKKAAEELLAKHGGNKTKAAEDAGMSRASFRRRLGSSPLPEDAPALNKSPSGGIKLSTVHVLDRKPADSVKSLLFTLTVGLGYPVRSLSEQWGVGEETIRKHAKNCGCLKYAEINPGEFAAVIIKPEGGRRG